MIDTPRPVNPEAINCEVCLKEIPISEAHVPEAEDYVMGFCGLECYKEWMKKAESEEDQSK